MNAPVPNRVNRLQYPDFIATTPMTERMLSLTKSNLRIIDA
jgi:hypothetical protein